MKFLQLKYKSRRPCVDHQVFRQPSSRSELLSPFQNMQAGVWREAGLDCCLLCRVELRVKDGRGAVFNTVSCTELHYTLPTTAPLKLKLWASSFMSICACVVQERWCYYLGMEVTTVYLVGGRRQRPDCENITFLIQNLVTGIIQYACKMAYTPQTMVQVPGLGRDCVWPLTNMSFLGRTPLLLSPAKEIQYRDVMLP